MRVFGTGVRGTHDLNVGRVLQRPTLRSLLIPIRIGSIVRTCRGLGIVTRHCPATGGRTEYPEKKGKWSESCEYECENAPNHGGVDD